MNYFFKQKQKFFDSIIILHVMIIIYSQCKCDTVLVNWFYFCLFCLFIHVVWARHKIYATSTMATVYFKQQCLPNNTNNASIFFTYWWYWPLHSSEAYGCQGGQRGFAENVMSVVVQKIRQRDLEKRGWIYCSVEKHIDVRRVAGGGGGGRNQTGWTMRAHTDALCLMSHWHFCSPSPPHRPSLTVATVREEKLGKGGREKTVTHCLYFTQGHKPQTKSRVRVHARASQSGSRQVWEGSGFTPWRSCSSLSLCFGVHLIDHLLYFQCWHPFSSLRFLCTSSFLLAWFAPLLRS